MPACEAGREEGQQRGKERAHLQSCAPQTRWVMSSTTSSIVVLQQHSRTSVRAVARALCRLPVEPANGRSPAITNITSPSSQLPQAKGTHMIQSCIHTGGASEAPHLHCHGVRVMVAGEEVEQHVKRQSLPSIGLNSRASRACSSTASRPSPMTCTTPKHVRAEICRLPGGHTRAPGT
jgi:hypothetical protein